MRVVAADNSTTMLAAEKNEHKLGKESVSLTVSAEGGGTPTGRGDVCTGESVSPLGQKLVEREE